MSRRFGRNQRRAFRAKVAALEAGTAALERRARLAEARSADAYEKGMSHFLNSQYLPAAMYKLVGRLEESLRPELAKEAERILQAYESQPHVGSFLEFAARTDLMEPTVTVITARIPELRANIAIQARF